MDELADVALLLLSMYVAPALTVLAASPDVNFAGRTGVILVALLLVLSAARSGERKEVEDLGVLFWSDGPSAIAGLFRRSPENMDR